VGDVVATLRILVADDHEIVRAGLRSLLEQNPGWTVCAEASNGREAVERAMALHPDVVIMDLAMPELNGLEATRQILEDSPRTAVLILSARDSEDLVRDVLAAGARSFILKSDAAKDLVAAVEGLQQGRPFFSARVAELVLRGYLHGPTSPDEAPPSAPVLTGREREVLQLLAEGHSTKEVAATLGISGKTAESHRSNLMRKLAVRSIPDLVRYAIRNHLVEP
jgi:DNA-binding NarL/FixJ family response regulator